MDKGVGLRFEVEKQTMGRAKGFGMWVRRIVALIGTCSLVGTGCTVSRQMTVTQRSSLEQQLLVRSLERAVAQLDVQRFAGKRATLDVFTLTDELTQIFVEEFIVARLQERGFHIVPDEEAADLRLEIFATVLGVDQSETLLGLPPIPTPVGFALPELAVYSATRNRGHTELQVYAFDDRTAEFMEKIPLRVGQANYNRYKVLTLINFTRSDLEE